MAKDPNPTKIIRLFADLHDHLYNGCIQHELNQIVRHTKDRKIIAICQRTAELLEIKIDISFQKEDPDQHFRSVKTLSNHLKKANEKYEEIVQLVPNYSPKWIDSLYSATEEVLILLSQELIRLDRAPNIYDNQDKEIQLGDLVAILCQDDKGQNYEHYGVVMQGAKGYTVKHFFSGPTVKAQNRLVEKGIGYVHTLPYTPEWILKERPVDSYQLINKRIETSEEIQNKIWNKLRYNCEHWAREMVTGLARCTQIEDMKDEAQKNKAK